MLKIRQSLGRSIPRLLVLLCLISIVQGGAMRRASAQGQIGDTLPPQNGEIAEGRNVPTDPAPETLAETEEQPRVSIFVKDKTIDEIFDMIQEDTSIEVRAMGTLPGTTIPEVRARDQTIEEVLDSLVEGKEWTWIRNEDGSYEMWDRQSFIDQRIRELVIRRSFQLQFVNAQEAQSAVQGVLSEVGQIAVNPRTNELIVTDLPDKVAQVESILKEIDVQLYTRSFYIQYALFDEIVPRIEEMKSEAGIVQLDPANRRILVTDTFQRIKQMEELIEMLDVEQPMRIYHLNDIGLDAVDALELIDRFIVPMTTTDSFVEYNESQGVLLVKDIPDVHDRILELLAAMDHSPRQIWFEGEILEVRRDFDFDFGVETVFDEDLADAFDDSGIDLPRVTTGANGLTVFDFLGNLQVTLNSAMSDEDTRLLLQPRALVRNGQEVVLNLTQENPQITTFFNNTTGGFNNFTSSSISFVPTGLELTVTPTISNRGLVELEINFSNSSPIFVELNTGSGGTQSAVGRNTSELQTVLIVPSGETRVLGGLISRSNRERNSGVPFLSRLPVIGGIFGSRSETTNDRNLLFFLTPTIVQEQPQVDIVQTPVNQAARLQDQDYQAQYPDGEPPALNPIPEDLMPYLQLDDGPAPATEDRPTTGPGDFDFSLLGPRVGSPVLPPPPDSRETIGLDQLRTEEPAPLESNEPAEIGFTGPGARILRGGGAAGMQGTVGAGEGYVAGERRGGAGRGAPTRTSTGRQSRIPTTAGGGESAGPEPTPRPTQARRTETQMR